MLLFADTETTGKPLNYKEKPSAGANWPRIVQLAIILAWPDGSIEKRSSIIIKPDGFVVPPESTRIHGISHERAMDEGYPLKPVLERLHHYADMSDYFVGHNVSFDSAVIQSEYLRLGNGDPIARLKKICTMEASTGLLRLPGPYGYKWPKLQELYENLFSDSFEGAHDASADIEATRRCFFELVRIGEIRL